MAELVHRNLESMLPELEELERSGIFSHEEIRQVVRRRRNLEYRLRRRPARKEDFLRAIQYEVNLDLLRKHRKKNLGLTTSVRADAEYGIQNRIHFLFRRTLKIFKADLKLWLQYIEFSKRCHHRSSLTKTFGQVLSLHPHNPGLWVMAAKFEFEDLKDVSSARVLLQQGLRTNSQARLLWQEYFRMELMHVDKVRKRRSILGLEMAEDEEVANASDEFLAYKTASVVYHQAVKTISDDIEFRLSFLPIYQLFEETDVRQQEVYDSIKTDFPSHPLCWDALARRIWTGVDTATLTDSQVEDLEKKTEQVFGEGLQTVGNVSDTAPLWERYIEWCRERVQDSSTSETLQAKAVQRLLDILKRASEECRLSETVFEQYVRILQQVGLSQKALAVSAQGTQAHPHSVPLWLLRLKSFCCHTGDCSHARDCSHTRDCSHASLSELCRQALDKVPRESSLPLWQYWIEQSVGGGASEREIEGVYQDGMECGVRAVHEALCSQYLDWAQLVGGIRKARKIYQRLLEVPPVAHSLYQKCIAVERSAEPPSMTRLRDLFERAIRDHGSHYPGLWLDFIRAELSFPGGRLEGVGQLHWRAVKALRPELTADFISEYSLLQTTQ